MQIVSLIVQVELCPSKVKSHDVKLLWASAFAACLHLWIFESMVGSRLLAMQFLRLCEAALAPGLTDNEFQAADPHYLVVNNLRQCERLSAGFQE